MGGGGTREFSCLAVEVDALEALELGLPELASASWRYKGVG